MAGEIWVAACIGTVSRLRRRCVLGSSYVGSPAYMPPRGREEGVRWTREVREEGVGNESGG